MILNVAAAPRVVPMCPVPSAGMHRHNNLVKEHEATEAELFELARKQKLMPLGESKLQQFEESPKAQL